MSTMPIQLHTIHGQQLVGHTNDTYNSRKCLAPVGGRRHGPAHQLQGGAMASSIIFEERVEIPMDVRTLADFRRWALSEHFPQTGRIDFVAGSIEVDMSPEEF